MEKFQKLRHLRHSVTSFGDRMNFLDTLQAKAEVQGLSPEPLPADSGWLEDKRSQADWQADMGRLLDAAKDYGKSDVWNSLMAEFVAAVDAGAESARVWASENALRVIEEAERMEENGKVLTGESLMKEARNLFDYEGKMDGEVFS